MYADSRDVLKRHAKQCWTLYVFMFSWKGRVKDQKGLEDVSQFGGGVTNELEIDDNLS